MVKSELPPIPKSFKQKISDEIGKLLLKGYCMTNDVCNICNTILMQDRQKKNWCVYCTFLKAPSKNTSKNVVQNYISANGCNKGQESMQEERVANYKVKENNLASKQNDSNKLQSNFEVEYESKNKELIKQEPKVNNAIYLTKEMRDKISQELAKLLLKGYKMTNETCPVCQTIFMQDRSKYNWCVYCDILKNETVQKETNVKAVNANKKVLLSKVKENTLPNGKASIVNEDSLDNSNPPKVQMSGDPLLKYNSLAKNIISEATVDENIYQSTQTNCSKKVKIVTQVNPQPVKVLTNKQFCVGENSTKSKLNFPLPVVNGSQSSTQVDLLPCLSSMEMKISDLSLQLQTEADFSKIKSISEAIKSCCEAAVSLKSYIGVKL